MSISFVQVFLLYLTSQLRYFIGSQLYPSQADSDSPLHTGSTSPSQAGFDSQPQAYSASSSQVLANVVRAGDWSGVEGVERQRYLLATELVYTKIEGPETS